MWISAEQLKSVLKHHWFVTPYTESNLKYTLYNNRSNVNVYFTPQLEKSKLQSRKYDR
jgi:hypothetical protein